MWFIVLLAGFSLYALHSLPRSRRPIPEEIDLDSVRNAMMEKHGWTRERSNAARAEYIRFLTLLQMKPGFMLIPWLDEEGRDDLDQFWHQHILDTAKYEADCKALFGGIVHHNPHVSRGSADESDAIQKTRRLYARTFESGPFGASLDKTDLSGCGACATVEPGHSAGHGGDGSHGGHGCGGHGGHSCGGHGCGGHGCGGH